MGQLAPPRRSRALVVIIVVVAVVVGVPLLVGAIGALTGETWRPPGVPVEFRGGLQGSLNGQRVTVYDIDPANGATGTGAPTARIQLGDRGGPEATLSEWDWLCDQAWGCVVVTSIAADPATTEPADDAEPAVGGARGAVTLVYVPPPWTWAVLLVLAVAVVARMGTSRGGQR